jgi:hypothetical protein
VPRNPTQTRDALARLRELLATRPDAALIGIVIAPIGDGRTVWPNVVTVDADAELLTTAGDELRRMATEIRQRQAEPQPEPAVDGVRKWWDCD